jgi:hydroxymethylpyrimidine pyrophosphatase-like HAD family hydrolase
MKLSALALDYDGTIAVNGALDSAVRDAIADARRRGVVVVLATGRQLTDLRRVAGDLACFDAIVAENGAVLQFPASGRHAMLAHAPSPAFLHELRLRHVAFAAGECVVEADASAAVTMLEVVRSLELPLTLTFNRGRLMVLPQAVAKSTGLRQALRALRISIHNTVGIGDAENDHDLLDACEVGAAVEWGSPALRSVADDTIPGIGPAAVADYIRRLMEQPRLSAAQMGRRRLVLGYEHSGAEVSLAVRGRTILVAGEPGTGKSCLAGLICEQLILQGYCVCVVDPEGDYRSLAALPDVMMLGGEDPPPTARELAQSLEHPDVSVVIDLSKLAHREKVAYVRTLMPFLVTMRRRTGLPHKILLDEAHYFLGDGDHTRMIDPELAGYIVVTYRISALDPAIRQTGDAVTLVTHETNIDEVTALLGMCRPKPPSAASTSLFGDLHANEAALLPGALESHGSIRRFQLAPRLTEHVRHRTKYVDMPVADAHAFVFAEGGHAGPRARTLKHFVDLLSELPAERLAGHLLRHDFSRWIGDVFRDRALALRIRTLEARVGCDDAHRVTGAIAQAIRARYETTADAA